MSSSGASAVSQKKYRTQENIDAIKEMFEHVSGVFLLKWQSDTLRESCGKLPLKVLPFLEVALEDLRDRALLSAEQGISTPIKGVAGKTPEGDALPSTSIKSWMSASDREMSTVTSPVAGSYVLASASKSSPSAELPAKFQRSRAESDMSLTASSKSLTTNASDRKLLRSRSWKSRREESPRSGKTSWRRGSHFGHHQKTTELMNSGEAYEPKQTLDDHARLWHTGLRSTSSRSNSPPKKWVPGGATDPLPLKTLVLRSPSSMRAKAISAEANSTLLSLEDEQSDQQPTTGSRTRERSFTRERSQLVITRERSPPINAREGSWKTRRDGSPSGKDSRKRGKTEEGKGGMKLNDFAMVQAEGNVKQGAGAADVRPVGWDTPDLSAVEDGSAAPTQEIVLGDSDTQVSLNELRESSVTSLIAAKRRLEKAKEESVNAQSKQEMGALADAIEEKKAKIVHVEAKISALDKLLSHSDDRDALREISFRDEAIAMPPGFNQDADQGSRRKKDVSNGTQREALNPSLLNRVMNNQLAQDDGRAKWHQTLRPDPHEKDGVWKDEPWEYEVHRRGGVMSGRKSKEEKERERDEASSMTTNIRDRSWKSRREGSPYDGDDSWRRGSYFGMHQKNKETVMKSGNENVPKVGRHNIDVLDTKPFEISFEKEVGSFDDEVLRDLADECPVDPETASSTIVASSPAAEETLVDKEKSSQDVDEGLGPTEVGEDDIVGSLRAEIAAQRAEHERMLEALSHDHRRVQSQVAEQKAEHVRMVETMARILGDSEGEANATLNSGSQQVILREAQDSPTVASAVSLDTQIVECVVPPREQFENPMIKATRDTSSQSPSPMGALSPLSSGYDVPTLVPSRAPPLRNPPVSAPSVSLGDHSDRRRAVSHDPHRTSPNTPLVRSNTPSGRVGSSHHWPFGQPSSATPGRRTASATPPHGIHHGSLGNQSLSPRTFNHGSSAEVLPASLPSQHSSPQPTAALGHQAYAHQPGAVPYKPPWPQALHSGQMLRAAAPPPRTVGSVGGQGHQSYHRR